MTDADGHISALVRDTVPTLIARPRIGIHSAAQLLITAGGNPPGYTATPPSRPSAGPARSRPASASDSDTASTRGLDRAANNALWIIANNRLIHDPATRESAAKCRAQGDSRNEILRILERYIAREAFTLIISALRPSRALGTPVD